jgi:xanthine phosphoribosyltransferase
MTGRRNFPTISVCTCSLVLIICVVELDAWVHQLPSLDTLAYTHRYTSRQVRIPATLLAAKKKQAKVDPDDLNRWYEAVDADARPDDVFWEEMERQRLLSQIGSGDDGGSGGAVAGSSPSGGMKSSPDFGFASAVASPPMVSSSTARTNTALQNTAMRTRSVDATLSEYEIFAVSDNWLDEDLAWLKSGDVFDGESERPLEDQLEDWENEDDEDEGDNAWIESDEPWDQWGKTKEEIENREVERMNFINAKASDFLLTDEEDEQGNIEVEREKAEFEARLSKLRLSSKRLEQARKSPKAAAFFSREPDAMEGYDRLWVSAIDNVCFKNLAGIFRNYGIQFADNFGDWEDGSVEDGLSSIEDIASFKARKVFEVTGRPCIASRTSFEIEPIPNLNPEAGRPTTTNSNTRVSSGYQFNDVGAHVDYICDAMRPLSEPSRVTRFKTCLCYYDGEMEIYDYGVCDVDLLFANSMRTFIPVAAAINEMIKTLELTFGLEYMQWLQKRMDEAASGVSGASLKLRDRVLRDGRVLPNEIIDVSDFMDSQIDVNLMDDCAKDLANRFMSDKPTKILTVATTGLVIALPMGKYLQVPVVYARKERSVVMADTYKAGYSSKTVGKNRELIVSKQHLHEDDRVLIIDDFLSSGASQEALLRIVSESGATAVGVGVLLEKVYDSGRQSLSGFDVPVHSLCRIASVKSGVIQLVEEEGFDRMQKSN